MKIHNKQVRRAYKDYYKDKAARIEAVKDEMDSLHPLMFRRYN